MLPFFKSRNSPPRLSLWLKVPFTIYLAVLVPVYWIYLGPQNFLWACDIALLCTLIALWRESALPAGMAMLVSLIPDLVWNLDFFFHLIAGKDLLGVDDTGYMFDSSQPIFVRLLSLFHVFLAPMLIWIIYRIGYDPRALRWQSLLTWLVLPLSYVVSTPELNINWVYGLGTLQLPWATGPYHVLVMMILVPVVLYLPVHGLMRRFFMIPSP